MQREAAGCSVPASYCVCCHVACDPQARRLGANAGWVTPFVSSLGALNACPLATCSRHGPVMRDGAGPEIWAQRLGWVTHFWLWLSRLLALR